MDSLDIEKYVNLKNSRNGYIHYGTFRANSSREDRFTGYGAAKRLVKGFSTFCGKAVAGEVEAVLKASRKVIMEWKSLGLRNMVGKY